MGHTASARKIFRTLKSARDLDPLIDRAQTTRYVLLGEASHGTHEYYTWRTAISKRLIQECGFTCIAVEGDWPDCYKINRFVKGFDEEGKTAVDVLKKFKRWPTWMWANWEVAALMEWLREYNRSRLPHEKVGFYGLDVYSLWESMDVIVNYLKKEDPKSAKLAIDAMRCFEPYEEGHEYAKGIMTLSAHCADETLNLLRAVRKRSMNYNHDPEASLNAEMNAQVIANAEHYYRSMIAFDDQSWNIRDRHMFETLEAIMKFHGAKGKVIVWEHNTHVGDAKYTDMRDQGMFNVGQLVREKHHDDVLILGFASYEGTVIASSQWGAKMQCMRIPAALAGSVEQQLHEMSTDDQLIFMDEEFWQKKFDQYQGHRAIGVVYHPDRERGNYVPSLMARRYDALIFIDHTQALHPLSLHADKSQIPETYPFGV